MNLEILIKEKINSLWKEYKDEEFCQFPPLSMAEIPDDGLVFVGINPSLSKVTKENFLKKNNTECEFRKLSYNVKQDYRYYKKFFEIAEKTDLNWGHIDVLYNRETQQKKVNQLLKTEKGHEFIYKQCMITKIVLDKIIDQGQRRIFVVNNTLARDLLGEYHKFKPKIKSNHFIGYDFIWNKNFGTYTYKKNIFFFTSMLTGQRALDKGSFQRLIWHINYVINMLHSKSN